MSSDSTGEIYVITKTDGSGINDVHQASASGSQSGSSAAPTMSVGTGLRSSEVGHGSYWAAGAAVVIGALPWVE
jgi:hypothetical protein